MERISKTCLVLVILAAVLIGAGCTDKAKYSTDIETSQGTFVVTSNAPVYLADSLGSAPINTERWLFEFNDNGYSANPQSGETIARYTIKMRADRLEDLEVSITDPSGNTSFVRNAKITKENGLWYFEAEHQNLQRVGLSIEGPAPTQCGSTDWDQEPKIIISTQKDKPTGNGYGMMVVGNYVMP